MESPLGIANYFIEKGVSDGHPVTPMKVIKLVYLAYGWHLAFNDSTELFDEDIQAWKYGPVVPSLYHKVKEYGNAAIYNQLQEFSFKGGDGFVMETPQVDDTEVIPLLDRIWDVYKSYTGVQLSSITHTQGTPWYITWHQLNGKNQMGTKIPTELIREHYKAKMAS